MGILRQFAIILPVLFNALHAHALDVAYCSSENTGSGFSAVSNHFQSNGACFQSCLDSYAFAIVQGQECWCSNYIPANTVSTSSCNENCPGFPSEKCGSASAGLYGYIALKKSPSGTAGGASTSPSNSAVISSQASVSNQSSGAFLSFQTPTPTTSSPPVASEVQTSLIPQTTSSSAQSSPSPAILTIISSITPVIITSVQTATTDANPVTVLATVTASPSVQTSTISSIQTSVITSIQASVVSSVETSVVSIVRSTSPDAANNEDQSWLTQFLQTPSTFFAATVYPSSTSTTSSSSSTVDTTTHSSTILPSSPTLTSSPSSISSSTPTSPSSSSSTLSTVFTPSSSSWTPTPVTSLITTTGIVKTVTVTPTAPPAITEAPSRVSQDSFWSNTSRVAGTFVGVALFIIVAAVIAVWCILRQNRKDQSTAAISTAGGATPQRRPSRLSQMGLLGSNSSQHGEKFVPGITTGVYSGEKDADDLTTPMDPRASYPRVVDQRLDPNSLWNPIQDNGSRISVRSFRDDQDYSRRMLRVANPDGDE